MNDPTDASRSLEATEAKMPLIKEQGEQAAGHLLDVIERINDSHGAEAANTALRVMLAHADGEISFDEAMTLARRFGDGDWRTVRDEMAEQGLGELIAQQ